MAELDLVVVGAGPAGIAAAVSASEAGARVAVVDRGFGPGGQIWRPESARAKPERAQAWLERFHAASPAIELHARHAVVDAELDDSGAVELVCTGPEGARTIRARKLILATGARERFLPFPGWTDGHVLGAGAIQALAKQGLALEGRRIVLAGTGPLLLAVAADLLERGVEIVSIVEQAPRKAVLGLGARVLAQASKRAQAAALTRRLARVDRLFSAWPVRTEAGRVTIARRGPLGRTSEVERACDLLACGFGLVPETRLARLLELDTRASDGGIAVDDELRSSKPGVFAAGECCGIGGVDVALAEGVIAGSLAAGVEPPAGLVATRTRERRFAAHLDQVFALRPELLELAEPATLVCRCEGVRYAELLALGPQPPSARLAKLHTRMGMGACQGRVCGPASAALFGWTPDRPRPPLSPIPLRHYCPPTPRDTPWNSAT